MNIGGGSVSVEFDGELDVVDQFKYFRSTVNDDGQSSVEINIKIGKAIGASGKVRKIWKLKTEEKLLLYESVVRRGSLQGTTASELRRNTISA